MQLHLTPLSDRYKAGCLAWLHDKRLLQGRARTRRCRAATSNVAYSPEDSGNDFDVGKEESFKRRRDVYDFDKWARHRSSTRYARHITTTFKSDIIKGILAPVAVEAVWAALISYYEFLHDTGQLPVEFPDLAVAADISGPFGLSTFALSLLLVFRTNTSYARFDEARKFWGGVVNRSRDLVRQGAAWFDPVEEAERLAALGRWMAAFPWAMKCHLRAREDPAQDLKDILKPDELKYLLSTGHRPNTVLMVISDLIWGSSISQDKKFRMDENLTAFSDYLGASERLLRTPIPPPYTRHTSRFLILWLASLPLVLWDQASWATIPVCTVIAFALLTIDEIGVQIEEPFSILPLEAISTTITTNIRQIINDDSRRYDPTGARLYRQRFEGFRPPSPAVEAAQAASAAAREIALRPAAAKADSEVKTGNDKSDKGSKTHTETVKAATSIKAETDSKNGADKQQDTEEKSREVQKARDGSEVDSRRNVDEHWDRMLQEAKWREAVDSNYWSSALEDNRWSSALDDTRWNDALMDREWRDTVGRPVSGAWDDLETAAAAARKASLRDQDVEVASEVFASFRSRLEEVKRTLDEAYAVNARTTNTLRSAAVGGLRPASPLTLPSYTPPMPSFSAAPSSFLDRPSTPTERPGTMPSKPKTPPVEPSPPMSLPSPPARPTGDGDDAAEVEKESSSGKSSSPQPAAAAQEVQNVDTSAPSRQQTSSGVDARLTSTQDTPVKDAAAKQVAAAATESVKEQTTFAPLELDGDEVSLPPGIPAALFAALSAPVDAEQDAAVPMRDATGKQAGKVESDDVSNSKSKSRTGDGGADRKEDAGVAAKVQTDAAKGRGDGAGSGVEKDRATAKKGHSRWAAALSDSTTEKSSQRGTGATSKVDKGNDKAEAALTTPTAQQLEPPNTSSSGGSQQGSSEPAEYIIGSEFFDFSSRLREQSDDTGNAGNSLSAATESSMQSSQSDWASSTVSGTGSTGSTDPWNESTAPWNLPRPASAGGSRSSGSDSDTYDDRSWRFQGDEGGSQPRAEAEGGGMQQDRPSSGSSSNHGSGNSSAGPGRAMGTERSRGAWARAMSSDGQTDGLLAGAGRARESDKGAETERPPRINGIAEANMRDALLQRPQDPIDNVLRSSASSSVDKAEGNDQLVDEGSRTVAGMSSDEEQRGQDVNSAAGGAGKAGKWRQLDMAGGSFDTEKRAPVQGGGEVKDGKQTGARGKQKAAPAAATGSGSGRSGSGGSGSRVNGRRAELDEVERVREELRDCVSSADLRDMERARASGGSVRDYSDTEIEEVMRKLRQNLGRTRDTLTDAQDKTSR